MGQLTKMATRMSQNVDLNEEEYCLYVLFSLFNAHYMPWLKKCYNSHFSQSFNDRFSNLVNNLQLAVPNIARRKEMVVELAKNACFQYHRKLQLTIDGVKIVSDDKENVNLRKRIIVKLLTNDTGNSNTENLTQLYHCNKVINIEDDFVVFLEFPNEMNDSLTKVYIEFYYQEDDAEGERFHLVKEYEISGYAGYTKTFLTTDQDDTTVSYQLNLRWELDNNLILTNIDRPDIITRYFSGYLLAMGSYFYRFYCQLYPELLTNLTTRKEALRSFGEVAFMVGSNYKLKLVPYVNTLLNDQINTLQRVHDEFVCAKECEDIYRTAYASLIVLDIASSSDQRAILQKLIAAPFNHIIRFKCWLTQKDTNVQIHKLLFKKLYLISKKKKDFRELMKSQALFDLILMLMIDSTKRADCTNQLNLYPMQKEAILLFVKYLKCKQPRKETRSAGDNQEEINDSGCEVIDDVGSNDDSGNSDSGSDVDKMQKILSENLAGPFNAARMFEPANIKQTVKLLRRMAKQLFKNNFLKTEHIDVNIVL